jgi:hypothetical protein
MDDRGAPAQRLKLAALNAGEFVSPTKCAVATLFLKWQHQ